MTKLTIYHNPECGTSRNTLAMIVQSGQPHDVVDYRANPPDAKRLRWMIAEAGLSVRDAIRQKDTPYASLSLDDPALGDDDLVAQMIAHPILINRPFVVSPKGVRLCRPSEIVLDLLDDPNIGPFTKEDGEVIIDAAGKRLI